LYRRLKKREEERGKKGDEKIYISRCQSPRREPIEASRNVPHAGGEKKRAPARFAPRVQRRRKGEEREKEAVLIQLLKSPGKEKREHARSNSQKKQGQSPVAFKRKGGKEEGEKSRSPHNDLAIKAEILVEKWACLDSQRERKKRRERKEGSEENPLASAVRGEKTRHVPDDEKKNKGL